MNRHTEKQTDAFREYGVYKAEILERLVKQIMHYITDEHYMKAYLQIRHQQNMNFTHKCTPNKVHSIMQST